MFNVCVNVVMNSMSFLGFFLLLGVSLGYLTLFHFNNCGVVGKLNSNTLRSKLQEISCLDQFVILMDPRSV